ncbi:membrane protein insertion efficiency factor YidD [Ruminococcus flavefaciens]|nr:membrane protein insertion efficiency factor YidD [Ruminococcus flavefaciens]
MPEHNTQLDEQIILAQVKQSLEESKKIVIRPKIKVWKDALLLLSIILIVSMAMIAIHYLTDISDWIFALILLLAVILFFAILGKKLLLTIITLYQKYAPEIVRSSCLFEPCCSEYMKLSVMKYGALKGFIRGIKRILRCRYPNGGIDEP